MTSSPNDPYGAEEPLPPPPPAPGEHESAPPIYASTPAPPPTTPTTGPTTGTEQSTTDTARDEAGRLRDVGTGAASHVAGTAREETRKVAGTARDQARQLADETRTQVNEQARVQRDRAAWGLRSLGDELESMARNSGQSGLATQWVHQGSELVRQGADFLEKREPGQLVDEVHAFARRRPGAFLLGAGVAGVLVGRLTRGAVAARRESDEGPEGTHGADYGYTPDPAYDRADDRADDRAYDGAYDSAHDPADDPARYASDTPTTVNGPGSEAGSDTETSQTDNDPYGSGRHTGRWT
jgi:hypothetical protein